MSTVIRAGDVARVANGLVSVDLADHLEEARAVVEDAQQRAARMLESARSDAERWGPEAREKGYEEGHREGYEKGYAEGKETGTTDGYTEAHTKATAKFDAQHAAIVSDIERVLDEMNGRRESIELAARRELLAFAISIAKKLTYRIGTLNHEAALGNLHKALQLVQSKTDLTIRVHPDDLAAIEEFAESVLRHAYGAGGVNVVSDSAIAPGGCVVKDASTEIDATLETQIDEIVSLLAGGREDRGADEDTGTKTSDGNVSDDDGPGESSDG